MPTGHIVAVRGMYEERARRLMQEAPQCSGATVIAVTEMGRTLDVLMQMIVGLEIRLHDVERGPRPPVAREQLRMEVTL